MGAKVPLMVAQANEANTATDETPAKAVPLRTLRLAVFIMHVTQGSVLRTFPLFIVPV
jgi:hypothetical protein